MLWVCLCRAGPFEDQYGIPTPSPEPNFYLNFDRYYPTDDITSWRHKARFATDMYQYQWDPVSGSMVINNIGGQTRFLLEDAVMRTPGWAHWTLPELVTIGDKDYYHIVFGDIADGFLQETYIQAGYTIDSMAERPYAINGGHPTSFIDSRGDRYSWGTNSGGYNWGSASGGDYVVKLSRPFGPTIGYDTGVGEAWEVGNAKDPLGVYGKSGNGSGNPGRVLVRQLLVDGEFVQQYLKGRLANKAIITQNIVAPDIEIKTQIDMSSIHYNTSTMNAVMNNTVLLKGSAAPPDVDWNMATDSQNSYVDAGKYLYTVGGGSGGSVGGYEYAGSTFDHTAIDWEAYFDLSDPTGNPWAYSENKPY